MLSNFWRVLQTLAQRKHGASLHQLNVHSSKLLWSRTQVWTAAIRKSKIEKHKKVMASWTKYQLSYLNQNVVRINFVEPVFHLNFFQYTDTMMIIRILMMLHLTSMWISSLITQENVIFQKTTEIVFVAMEFVHLFFIHFDLFNNYLDRVENDLNKTKKACHDIISCFSTHYFLISLFL